MLRKFYGKIDPLFSWDLKCIKTPMNYINFFLLKKKNKLKYNDFSPTSDSREDWFFFFTASSCFLATQYWNQWILFSVILEPVLNVYIVSFSLIRFSSECFHTFVQTTILVIKLILSEEKVVEYKITIWLKLSR